MGVVLALGEGLTTGFRWIALDSCCGVSAAIGSRYSLSRLMKSSAVKIDPIKDTVIDQGGIDVAISRIGCLFFGLAAVLPP